jgi:hypothetical protein
MSRTGLRSVAENMIRRLVTEQEDPRDMRDVTFLKLRELHPLPPSEGGLFGISIAKIAKKARPLDPVAQRSLIREIANGSAHGKHPGSNGIVLRRAMCLIKMPIIAVSNHIDEFWPNWQTEDFALPNEPRNRSRLIAGKFTKVHGFLFVGKERTAATILERYCVDDMEKSSDAAQVQVGLRRAHLRLMDGSR